MKTVALNILAIILGLFIGSLVNMGLIYLGPVIITPPEGADTTTYEGLKATIHLFTIKHYIFPFLGHALGTLVGSFVAAFIAGSRKILVAYFIGILFLIGGIINIFMLPSPMWFNIFDIVLAYIPMAWIGSMMYLKIKGNQN